MEAASARYAARDRFSAFGEPTQSQLQRYIQNAVDPQNFEPNLALDLEIADLINSKKGNAPREAAVAIVNFVNHRIPSVSLLALTLLDICVKNCGYAFHLQISTKEFLNELVRKFPERPPIRPSRVQLRILSAIEEWRQTICQTSKYKEDLGFIRDMHRLLSYKGYQFPEIRREDAAVLNPSDSLKSAEEMEEEERDAQSAKLQELIRRGGPEDLREANRLMKIMAGYDTKNKTDYRAKAAEEVSRVQQKAKLLEERLQSFKPGDTMSDGDVFSELASSLQSAHPKIQKMCEEESDDHEAVAKLLEINDSIHRTIERYRLMKSGDVAAAQRIPHGTLGTSTGVSKNSNNELSLIDFGSDEPTAEASSTTVKQSSIEDDLLGLSMSDTNYGQGGGIALGFGANSSVPGPALLSSVMQQSSAGSTIPTASSQQSQGPARPNYDAFAAFNTPPQSRTPQPSLLQQQMLQQQAAQQRQQQLQQQGVQRVAQQAQQQAQQQAAQQRQPGSDPFSIINNPGQAVPNPLYNPAAQPRNNQALNAKSNEVPPLDDDWNFSSALPPENNNLIVSDKPLQIVFQVSRRATDETVVDILAKFSNRNRLAVTELTFQVAVTKAYQLKLTPQSGRRLGGGQWYGITQPIEIHGVPKGQAGNVKIRWRISYKAGDELQQDQGEVPPLGIS